MSQPVVLSAVRSPMGRHEGSLSETRVDDLASVVIREAVGRSRLQPAAIEEVVFGIVNASGEAMGNIARFAALLGGLPVTTAGVSMNRYCGSGLSAVNALAHEVAFGGAQAGVAGGAETMSRSTWPVLKPRGARYVGPIAARDAMWSGGGGPQHPDLEADGTMIEMPEGAQSIAQEFGITRKEMDEYALESHRRASAAADEGWFDDEIVPIALPDGAHFEHDETIRKGGSLEKLGALPSYYPDCPDITAGNTSPINDGASALVIASEDAVPSDSSPLGRVVATAVAGVEPKRFSIGPVVAIDRVLSRARVSLEEVGLIEINEAFAVQMLVCISELGADPQRVNVNGGALALGHALGNSGARIAVTLLHEMRRRGVRYGIASLCIGAGQGIATLFERREG